MGNIAATLEGLWRPAALVVLLLLGLGMASAETTGGHGSAGGLDCRPITDSPRVNRAICGMNPARLWNMPVSRFLP